MAPPDSNARNVSSPHALVSRVPGEAECPCRSRPDRHRQVFLKRLSKSSADGCVISWFAYKVGGEDALEPGQAPPSEPDLDYAHVQIRRGLKYNESFIKAVQLLQGQKDKMSPEALAHFTSPSDEAALPEGKANSIKPRK